MLDKLKVAVVLLVIGAVSGFLIWGTNELTFDGIMDNREAREQSFYKEIFGLEDEFKITFTKSDVTDLLEEVVLLDSNDEVIGYIYKSTDNNSYGEVVVLVGVNLDGTISNVIISSTTNTPTYVKGITDDFLSPFVGQEANDVQFDSSTGASFTYGSVKKLVERSVEYYNENRGDE